MFTYSLLVVDNDRDMSGQSVVEDCRQESGVRIAYHVEPERNIALARNKAVTNACGEFIAFIDDDEYPDEDWLSELHKTACEVSADAVLGPVISDFATAPPGWVVNCGLLERPTHRTGTIMAWCDTRTGNVLIRRSVFAHNRNLFRAEFRHSEDLDLFKRLTEQGYMIVWCNEARVFEVQGTQRFKVGYFIKRALLRGNVSLRLQANKPMAVGKSAIAVLLYTSLLPVLAIVNQGRFVLYLIKNCDHVGRLLAACKVDLQKRLACDVHAGENAIRRCPDR
jgi:glycosyltransferase involved in cell wall biosynthesis